MKRQLRPETAAEIEVYAKRVRELEEQGLCTSDAQGAADCEQSQGRGPWRPNVAPCPKGATQPNVLYNGPDMELWGKVGVAARAEGFSDPRSAEYEAFIFMATINGEEVAVYCAHSHLREV